MASRDLIGHLYRPQRLTQQLYDVTRRTQRIERAPVRIFIPKTLQEAKEREKELPPQPRKARRRRGPTPPPNFGTTTPPPVGLMYQAGGVPPATQTFDGSVLEVGDLLVAVTTFGHNTPDDDPTSNVILTGPELIWAEQVAIPPASGARYGAMTVCTAPVTGAFADPAAIEVDVAWASLTPNGGDLWIFALRGIDIADPVVQVVTDDFDGDADPFTAAISWPDFASPANMALIITTSNPIFFPSITAGYIDAAPPGVASVHHLTQIAPGQVNFTGSGPAIGGGGGLLIPIAGLELKSL